MTKQDIINDVVATLVPDLNDVQLEKVKFTLIIKMQGLEVKEMETLPSTVIYDNEYVFRRFSIDLLAKGCKPSSVKTYQYMLQPFFFRTNKNYRQVTGEDITDYLAYMLYGKNYSRNYVATICRSMFRFFEWAYRKKHIESDIMRDVERIQSQQKKKDRLTDEEIESCREVCKDLREKALFELMLSTGMRVGEIAELEVKDLDLVGRNITIYGIKTDKYREGILSIKCRNDLVQYLDGRKSGKVFQGKYRAIGLSKSTIEKIAIEIGVRANVHCKTNVHCYRKTFASVMYQKTKNVKLVSILLGHASTAVTEQCYLIDSMEDIKYQVKTFL